jgi:hypothetical protein
MYLRRIHRNILAKIPDEPVPAKKLASRVGYRNNAHFRQALADLLRDGRIFHSPDGYRRARS